MLKITQKFIDKFSSKNIDITAKYEEFIPFKNDSEIYL